MHIPSELLSVAGVVLVVVLALVIRSVGRKSPIERSVARGPANLKFTCAGCSGQFTHTRRTIGAWEKGTRRFFCNECHKKWRNSQPPQSAQGKPPSSAKPSAPSRGSSNSISPAFSQRARLGSAKSGGSGCLGMLVLAIAFPIGVAIVAAQYA
jgi:hypothetical protein